MRIRNLLIPSLITIFLFSACNKDEGGGDWLIPSEEVFDGGPGKDGIPAIGNPQFAKTTDINFLQDDDLIIGFKNDGIIRGYSHQILDQHEIVNDRIGDVSLAVTYCPLTGTAVGWDRMVDGTETTFGVSGLLYNSNLIPYDRKTDSNWSQMRLDCVNGELSGDKIKTHQLIETTWGTWKEWFPNAEVLTRETGFSRSYGIYPYVNARGEDYRVTDWLLFPVTPFDERLGPKERVLGVILGGTSKVYRFDKFTGNTVKIVQDEVAGSPIVVVGNSNQNFLLAFSRQAEDQTLLDFSPIQDKGSIVLEDQEGNEWNVFGEAVSGPRTGERLTTVESFMGYWFAWGAFQPDIEIFE